MSEVLVENSWGVIEGLDYETSRSLGDRLNTEIEFQGTRVKFKPTRYALDLLVKELGRESFHSGCRFAWAHFYKDQPKQDVEFEFVTQPFNHQREWWSIIKDMPYFALEWEMGLGKSKTILDVCQWAYAKGELDALLVVTLKGVHRKWIEKEVPTHFPRGKWHAAFWNPDRVDSGMWYGKDARNRKPLVESDRFAVAAVNFESVHRAKCLKFCERFLRSRKAAIVVDESQHIKTPSTAVTKALLNKLKKLSERRFITTGTMSTGSPLDAWSQYSFLDSKILDDMPYWAFKEEHAILEKVGDMTYEAWEYNKALKKSIKVERPVVEITGYKNEDKLCKRLDPFRSRLLKSDCIDLPRKIYRMRSFEMSEAQRKAYNAMSKDFLVELEGGKTMTASMAMVKMVRLQQIACGFVVPDDADPMQSGVGEPLDKNNPRLEALMQEVEKAKDGAIIWAYWRYSLNEIANAMREAYGDGDVIEYHGGVSDEDKARNLKLFQDRKATKFVGNPMSGGTGIDLVEADSMFYFNNSFNLALRLQSEDRNHRIGQESNACTITDLECLGTIDRPQLRALKEKKDVASLVSGDILKSWLTEAI